MDSSVSSDGEPIVESSKKNKLLMFSDIEGCQQDEKHPQSTSLCSPEFYEKIRSMMIEDRTLHVAFLGDYFDQGMHVYSSITGLHGLLKDKELEGRVFVILGNRDVNKLRFIFELQNICRSNSLLADDVDPTNPTKLNAAGWIEFSKGWASWYRFYDELEYGTKPTIDGEYGKYDKTDAFMDQRISFSDNEVARVKHILDTSMAADKKTADGKSIGLHSFVPIGKYVNDEGALKYLKKALGIKFDGDGEITDALDVLGFFSKCKIAHVFDGDVLLSHAGGFDPYSFFNKEYVESFKSNTPLTGDNYLEIIEACRKKLCIPLNQQLQRGGTIPDIITGTKAKFSQPSISSRERALKYVNDRKAAAADAAAAAAKKSSVAVPLIAVESVQSPEPAVMPEPTYLADTVSESIEAYNTLLQDVLNEIGSGNFTWKFALLQALGLKPQPPPSGEPDAQFNSLIQSCSQDGCKGPTDNIPDDKGNSELIRIFTKSGIKYVSYGHKPVCFPIPIIYSRPAIEGVTFISNDTSNAHRDTSDLGNNVVVGTSITKFDDEKLTQAEVEVIYVGPGTKPGVLTADKYKTMFGPFSSAFQPPQYVPSGEGDDARYTLTYQGGVLPFNIKKKAFDTLIFNPTSVSAAVGGRKRHYSRRGRHNSQRNLKTKNKHVKRNKYNNKKTRKGIKTRRGRR